MRVASLNMRRAYNKTTIMKRFLLIFAYCLIYFTACSQTVIESSPQYPSANDDIVLTFHADQGNAGLKGYSGYVYAHTGVIMKNSTQWTHVKHDWSVNSDDCKLTKTATNTYQLTIGKIQDFYGLTETEAQNVDKLAFVFRSSDGTKEGKGTNNTDIYLSIIESNKLYLYLNSPTTFPLFITGGESFEINCSANKKSQFKLLVDDVEKYYIENVDNFSYNLTTETSGTHTIKIKATSESLTAEKEFSYVISQKSNVATMPQNLLRGVNKTGDKQATFVLFAPHKTSAYVIGSFNNWQPSQDCLMNLSEDGNYFFLTIDNLDPDQEYLYQYIVDESITIADPYTEKIYDPDNDKYIPSTTYPNLISYPEGKTTGIASTFILNKNQYDFETKNFTAPKSENLVIYELLIRDFSTSGTVKGVVDSLDYLQNLGINAIEFLPITEFEGNDSWGYNPSFYFAADKAYGTQDDYKNLIDQCHKRGIAVIFDMVLNHAFGSSPFVKLYFDGQKTTSQSPWFNVDSPNKVYSWGYDFNHETEETKILVDSIITYWMTEYNIDGIRFDFTKGFTNTVATTDAQCSAYDESRIAILKRIYDKMQAVKPNSYMICEHLTDNSEEKVLANYGIMLWTNVNYAFCQSTMGYSSGCEVKNIYYPSLNFSAANSIAYAESHDEERMMFKALRYGNGNIKTFSNAMKNAAAAGAILLSVPGPKMIWQFGELGYDYSINYNITTGEEDDGARTGRKPVPTDYLANADRKAIYDMYALVNKLRNENDAFSGTATLFSSDLFKIVYLTGQTNSAIVVANFDPDSKTKTVDFPNTGTWYELVNKKQIDIQQTSNSLTLNAGQVKIFTDKQPTENFDEGTLTAVEQAVKVKTADINLYPNPCIDKISISSPTKINCVEIWDMNGKCVSKVKNNLYDEILEIDTNQLTSGIYIVAIKMGNTTISKKIAIIK